MKLRVIGTKTECEQAQRFFDTFGFDTCSHSENVLHCSVSGLYPNRNSINQYRVYIEIVCKDEKDIFYSLLPKYID